VPCRAAGSSGGKGTLCETAARWLQALGCRRASVADVYCSVRPVSIHRDILVVIIELCMDADKCWTVRELAEHTLGFLGLQCVELCGISDVLDHCYVM